MSGRRKLPQSADPQEVARVVVHNDGYEEINRLTELDDRAGIDEIRDKINILIRRLNKDD